MRPTSAFKIYHDDDIHRFRLASARPSFQDLRGALCAVFGPLRPTDKIQYLDEDQDKITVSSQPEWEEALCTMSSDRIKRIYVTTQPIKRGEGQVQARAKQRVAAVRETGKKPTIEALMDSIAAGQAKRIPACFNMGAVSNALQIKTLNLLREKQYDKAVNTLLMTVRLNKNSNADIYNLATTYSLMGEGSLACKYLQRSLSDWPGDRSFLLNDSDLDNIRHMSMFRTILLQAGLQSPKPDSSPPKRVTIQLPQRSEVSTLEHIARQAEPMCSLLGSGSHPTHSQIPVLEEVASTLSPPASEFMEQIFILREMGYEQDHETLEACLVVENGDITAVLEILESN